ncbi:MAG: UDP-N-acetyl glucosamine 2-epimerase [Candidatus Omnitrophota bacterium]
MIKKEAIKLVSIVGARPQFIKMAPFVKAVNKFGGEFIHRVIHTGQHYDYNMSRVFFEELGLAEPEYHLNVGSGGHGRQTGQMLEKTEQALNSEKPDWVIVYGDTNSTLAGALAAAKAGLLSAHIEAGLRSYNRNMPEETNRVLTDHCSDVLFCPTSNSVRNLRKEGFTNIAARGELISDSGDGIRPPVEFPIVVNTGDIMYDAFLLCSDAARKRSVILEKLKLEKGSYCLATIHRAENTDNEARLRNILEALSSIGRDTRVVFPAHPRTLKTMETAGLKRETYAELLFIEPVGYYDMLLLEKNAYKILTDSGGVQKEAFFSRVPCVTLRDETEWTETVASGWNTVAGTDKENILDAFYAAGPGEAITEYGSGGASLKILQTLKDLTV